MSRQEIEQRADRLYALMNAEVQAELRYKRQAEEAKAQAAVYAKQLKELLKEAA